MFWKGAVIRRRRIVGVCCEGDRYELEGLRERGRGERKWCTNGKVGTVVEIGFLRLSSVWSVRCYRQEGLALVWGWWVGEFAGGGGRECRYFCAMCFPFLG